MLNTICNTQYSHYKLCTALNRRRVGSWDILGQSHKLTPPPPPPVPALQARCSPKKQVYIVISLKDIVISLKDTFISLSDDLTQISYNSSSLHHQSSYKTAALLQQVLTEISYYCIRRPPTQVPGLASYEAAVHLLTLPYWQRSPESPCSPPNWSSIK